MEIYKYQSSISRRYYTDDDFSRRQGGRDKEGEEGRKKEYIQRTQQNAYNKVRRLINANFDENSLFITLTYKKNMQDIEAANYDLKKFLQKMKRRQKDFKYVSVIEFQKRGAIHYHMLCNLRLTWGDHAELQSHERWIAEIWNQGFVDIGYKKNDNAGAYLIKYMTKENADERLEGKKRYFFSRSLKQPEELTAGAALEIIKQFEGMPPVFTNEYVSEFDGKVQYSEYNPKRINYKRYAVQQYQEITKPLETVFNNIDWIEFE